MDRNIIKATVVISTELKSSEEFIKFYYYLYKRKSKKTPN